MTGGIADDPGSGGVDRVGVDTEVPAQLLAGVGHPESVRAETDKGCSDEPCELVGQCADEVADRDDRDRILAECPPEVTDPRKVVGMIESPPLHGERIVTQLLPARD